jgi:hypothetical protein
MDEFLNDALEPIIISRPELKRLLEKIASLWPATIYCTDKAYGLESFTCRSVVSLGRGARDNFELVDWDVHEEIAGVALDFFGMAIKHSAKYLTSIEVSKIDYDIIIGNMDARDDIIITAD